MVEHLVEPPYAFLELVKVGGPRLAPVVDDGPLAQQHLELVALETLQPARYTPHDVDGLQGAIAQDVNVVVLSEEGSSFAPGILRCVDRLAPELSFFLR